MNIDFLSFMKGYYEKQGIQFLLFSHLYDNLEQLDYGFRRQMFQDFNYNTIIDSLNEQLKPGVLYHVEDEFRLFFIIYQVPMQLREILPGAILFIGPVLFQPATISTFQTVMNENLISQEFESEVKEFLNRIPMPGPFDNWMTTASYLFSTLIGEKIDSQTLLQQEKEHFHFSFANYSISANPEVALKSVEERYELETAIMNAVVAGNIDEAILAHSRFRQHKLMPRAADPVRNKKNMLIILNTLLRKAAQAGGVHPLHIDNLSTQVALQIESLSSVTALETYGITLVRKYCLLVKNYSRRDYSSLVQTCLDYIDFHYSEDLSLDLMAKLCSVSNTYLSSLFKKEVNMTLTDYINSTRIRQSLILLNTTTMSIQEISMKCGFSDSNYFTRTFKKFQGQSPKGYRETIRRSGKEA